jgi:hypothetical protein
VLDINLAERQHLGLPRQAMRVGANVGDQRIEPFQPVTDRA